MPEAPILVVAALREEVGPLLRRLRDPTRRRVGRLRFALGELAGRPLAVVTTGDGAARARTGLETLLAAGPPARLLLVVGVAGGLTPDLPAGGLVAGRAVRTAGGPDRSGDPDLLRAAVAAGAAAGTVVSSPRLVAEPLAKAELLARERLRGPAVVDLESAVFAGGAGAAGLPWGVVRAVSDPAGEGLPSFLAACLDGGGAVRRTAVVRYAVTHPAAWGPLLRLRHRVRVCAEGLAGCVEATVGRLPSTFPDDPR